MRSRVLILSALCCAASAASAKDLEPLSTTAIGITGPVRLEPALLRIGKASFPLAAVARGVKSKGFSGEPVVADLYRVTRPADPVLNGSNRLCGGGGGPDPVRWLFVWRDKDGTVTLAPASSVKRPAGVDDSCGTYSYTEK